MCTASAIPLQSLFTRGQWKPWGGGSFFYSVVPESLLGTVLGIHQDMGFRICLLGALNKQFLHSLIVNYYWLSAIKARSGQRAESLGSQPHRSL